MCGNFFHCDHQASFQSREKISFNILQRSESKKLFRRLMGSYLCRSCIEKFRPVTSPLCQKCGLMYKSREGGDHVCEACMRSGHRFGIARTCGIYDNALMAVIHAFKYGEKIQLSHPLSVILLATFLKYWQQRPIDLIVPVPLNKKRFRKRGFNQAYLLMRGWPALMRTADFPVKRIEIGRNLLTRIRETPPQTDLGRKDRLSNIKKAFALSAPEAVKGRRVLIVDDVYTTGATVSECAHILFKGGAREVDILTLARTV
jgi:ComF family protein